MDSLLTQPPIIVFDRIDVWNGRVERDERNTKESHLPYFLITQISKLNNKYVERALCSINSSLYPPSFISFPIPWKVLLFDRNEPRENGVIHSSRRIITVPPVVKREGKIYFFSETCICKRRGQILSNRLLQGEGGGSAGSDARIDHVKFPVMASGLIEANWKSISRLGYGSAITWPTRPMTNGLSKYANACGSCEPVHRSSGPRINKPTPLCASNFIQGRRLRISKKWCTRACTLKGSGKFMKTTLSPVPIPLVIPPLSGLFHFRVKAGKWDFSEARNY